MTGPTGATGEAGPTGETGPTGGIDNIEMATTPVSATGSGVVPATTVASNGYYIHYIDNNSAQVSGRVDDVSVPNTGDSVVTLTFTDASFPAIGTLLFCDAATEIGGDTVPILTQSSRVDSNEISFRIFKVGGVGTTSENLLYVCIYIVDLPSVIE